jgi:hypothetical protein
LKKTHITFLKEFKDYIKDITEIKEIVGDMKSVKNIYDSVSPSPLFFTKKVVV